MTVKAVLFKHEYECHDFLTLFYEIFFGGVLILRCHFNVNFVVVLALEEFVFLTNWFLCFWIVVNLSFGHLLL